MLGASIALAAMISVYGCKKKGSDEHPHDGEHPHETAAPAQVQQPAVSTDQTEQTMCAVMSDMKINKAVFVEYKGKKVYFCCPDCKGKFEAEPEKYAAKLPQFQNQ